ncbi:MAG: M20/M25/M40 family metallo-hydrolase [Opitutaceae bacterium]|jgi:acetylornithine deacetylase/succinyl-diaminopimelate desuccinylase-like protein
MKAVAKDPSDLAAAQRLAAASTYYNAIMRTTCVATLLQAGHADNALPQVARATVNCRIFSGDSLEYVQRTLAEVLADPGIKLTQTRFGLESPVSPLLPEVMGAIERLSAEMWPGIAVYPVMDPWASDSVYLRRAGIPSYGVSAAFGDGNGNTHAANECLLVQSFIESDAFLYRLVKSLTSGVPADR